MLCLGIEGTAHTIGAGVVDERCRVLSNEIETYVPPEGGIHPREAANHHAERVLPVIEAAMAMAGRSLSELDLVSFSQGPGLGPCLRTAATAARALAVSLGIPIIGVNHCIAHLEIGRGTTPAKDPVLLYVSGGNTQVIAFAGGRYRIFGETLDIGVGNLLDKFGRGLGIPFPAGPRIERLAEEYAGSLSGAGPGSKAGSAGGVPGTGPPLIQLPYSVKGMDIAFSGILTAAEAKKREGAAVPSLCYAMQETVFAMLVEVTERALAHAEKEEVLLGGGVAANTRLRRMLERMASDRGARMFVPEKRLCIDNGAMIAWLGILMHRSGARMPVSQSQIRQRFRTDEVEVVWRDAPHVNAGSEMKGYRVQGTGYRVAGDETLRRRPSVVTRNPEPGTRSPFTEGQLLARGAEAELRVVEWMGRRALAKRRVPKAYRLPELDARLRQMRTKMEARLLREARLAGVPTPLVYDVDLAADACILTMEFIEGEQVKRLLNGLPLSRAKKMARIIGASVGALHGGGIIHGDLTTSNMLWAEDKMYFIDFGLGSLTDEVEARGVDLRVLKEAFGSTHSHLGGCFDAILKGYCGAFGSGKEAVERMEDIASRGRYTE